MKKVFLACFCRSAKCRKMRFNFDASIQTNAKISHNFTRKYENLNLKRRRTRKFELGSTIVLISQKDF